MKKIIRLARLVLFFAKVVYDSSNQIAICPNYQTGVSWFNHAMTPQNPLESLQITRPCMDCVFGLIVAEHVFNA